MYDLGSALDDVSVDPGTNILVSGPPLAGKRRLAMRVLAAGAADGQGSVVVTTRDSADRVLADLRTVTDNGTDAPVGVVDCVTQHQGRSPTDSETVKYASSPTDMTGIGIKFSEFLERFYQEREVVRNRVLLDSLSTLLAYSDLQTVFQFMHVFTSRVEDGEAVGIHVLDETAHDDETLNTLTQLFDGVVSVPAESDRLELRLPGADRRVVEP